MGFGLSLLGVAVDLALARSLLAFGVELGLLSLQVLLLEDLVPLILAEGHALNLVNNVHCRHLRGLAVVDAREEQLVVLSCGVLHCLVFCVLHALLDQLPVRDVGRDLLPALCHYGRISCPCLLFLLAFEVLGHLFLVDLIEVLELLLVLVGEEADSAALCIDVLLLVGPAALFPGSFKIPAEVMRMLAWNGWASEVELAALRLLF